jgi:hypothetical protein
MPERIQYRTVGQQTLAVSSSAVSITIAGSNVERMIVRVRDADIRWDVAGNTPTSSAGFPEYADTDFMITDEVEVANFKAIRKASTDAEINVLFQRRIP